MQFFLQLEFRSGDRAIPDPLVSEILKTPGVPGPGRRELPDSQSRRRIRSAVASYSEYAWRRALDRAWSESAMSWMNRPSACILATTSV